MAYFYSHLCPKSLCGLYILMLRIVLQPHLYPQYLLGVNHNLHRSVHGETNHNYNYSYSLIMHMAFV